MTSRSGKNELTRVGNKLRQLLINTKQKNNLPSLTVAGETIADFVNGVQRKKRIKEKIIREIEF